MPQARRRKQSWKRLEAAVRRSSLVICVHDDNKCIDHETRTLEIPWPGQELSSQSVTSMDIHHAHRTACIQEPTVPVYGVENNARSLCNCGML